ncbi:MAG TPA: hypothetical protein VE548_02170 [Nitrososphaeraceae archaeon]|nr:hypothetical protein [Nitrososphaeraceae archaeon]
MSLGSVTTMENREISERLKGMLVDLRDTISSAFENIEERMERINIQAHSEGFEDHEINLLIRMYLSEVRQLSKRQIKYLLTDKPRIKKQKSLIENRDNFVPEDVPEIPAPDYKIVVPDQVIEEVITSHQPQQQQQEQQQQRQQQEQEECKPDYALENLRSQIESYKSQIEELIVDKKNIEEKYKQLEAKTLVTPSNPTPTLRGNNLRTKIVVTQLFREVLALKGSKMIYANILIDLSQNKYVRLEPFEESGV